MSVRTKHERSNASILRNQGVRKELNQEWDPDDVCLQFRASTVVKWCSDMGIASRGVAVALSMAESCFATNGP